MSSPGSVDELEARYNRLTDRAQALERSVTKVEADLEAHKRALKKSMDECREEGFDPNNLKDEISHFMEVISLKLDTFEADLKAGEAQIAPMLEEIRTG